MSARGHSGGWLSGCTPLLLMPSRCRGLPPMPMLGPLLMPARSRSASGRGRDTAAAACWRSVGSVPWPVRTAEWPRRWIRLSRTEPCWSVLAGSECRLVTRRRGQLAQVPLVPPLSVGASAQEQSVVLPYAEALTSDQSRVMFCGCRCGDHRTVRASVDGRRLVRFRDPVLVGLSTRRRR